MKEEKERLIKDLATKFKNHQIKIEPDQFSKFEYHVDVDVSTERKKYFVGVDFAEQPKWWQKILFYLGLRKNYCDYTSAVVYKNEDDGSVTIVDKYTF